MSAPGVEIQSLSKNCNEALILAALAEGPRHGYQLALDIAERSDGYFGFRHGTLYPILHKLEKSGFIRGSWKQEEGMRKRKYYALTSRGKTYSENLNSDLKKLFHMLFSITEGKR